MKTDFYIYEHWRPDKNEPFYVGKGRGRRAWSTKPRNPYYDNVVRKLATDGLCVEVKLVVGELAAQQAYDLEIERIAFWRNAGIRLTNMTAGGEGMLEPTDELRSRLSVISKSRVRTPEWRANISKGVSNQSEETRAKRSASMLGITRSAETKAKVSAAKRNPSKETRERNRIAAQQSWKNPEYRARQLATRKAKRECKLDMGTALPEGEIA